MITQPTKLSICNRQLKVTQDEEWNIPLEDISSIVLESPQINMSAKLFGLLAENKILVYSCDDKHLPNGMFVPFATHSRELKVLKGQLNCTESFKKRCWQKIIKQKVLNQSKVLQYVYDTEVYKIIGNMVDKINSGDTKNIEAIAAKEYFRLLFNNEFIRGYRDIYNAALNYGYSIIRGAIARSIVSYGYMPAIGLHHKSELNNYNLVDDFIEPFRSVVDLWVKNNINEEVEFDKNIRAGLVNLLNVDVIIQGKMQSVNNAINIMIASFTSAINDDYNYKKLELPELIPIKEHSYE